MADFEGKLSSEFFVGFECDLSEYRGKFEKRHFLPKLCELMGEEFFADVAAGWSETGLHLLIQAECSMHESNSVELFIDTKNLKTAKTTHRFQHHFLFYPERHEGIQAKEITSFRTEDRHPLAHSDELEIKTKVTAKGYEMTLFIPEKCLVGNLPEMGGAMGFTYRINRDKYSSQHFGLSDNSKFEIYPYMWPSVKLVK